MSSQADTQYTGQVLDHLGLVADTIEELSLIERIDQKLSLSTNSGSKVTMGERVAAMILNGLGFVNARLYLFPDFFRNKPIDRLLGSDIAPEALNDDALGRCLDAIADYGTTKLFTELAFAIGQEKGLLGKSAHLDTSTLLVHGTYEEEVDESVPYPAHGYSKAKRPDLKQMVIQLATTGQSGFPVWMEAHSGNASDQQVLPQAAAKMKAFCQDLKASPDFIYVGDAAMYSNILAHEVGYWVSRVPSHIKEAKALLQIAEEEVTWEPLDRGYRHHTLQVTYKDVVQRWSMVYSPLAYARESKTLERKIEQMYKDQSRAWKHLSQQRFSGEQDAQRAAHQAIKKLRYHQANVSIVPLYGHARPGRPIQGAEKEIQAYQVQYNLVRDEAKIQAIKHTKGRFILATNQLDEEKLPAGDILSTYKEQAGVEKGFKFIKNDAFAMDGIFLKTPERIGAAMMIMTLCLMVYGYAEHMLRQTLQAKEETIPNQLRKPTRQPSMQWVYSMFSGVHVLHIHSASGDHTTMVINLNDLLRQIIGYFGPRAKSVYLDSP